MHVYHPSDDSPDMRRRLRTVQMTLDAELLAAVDRPATGDNPNRIRPGSPPSRFAAPARTIARAETSRRLPPPTGEARRVQCVGDGAGLGRVMRGAVITTLGSKRMSEVRSALLFSLGF